MDFANKERLIEFLRKPNIKYLAQGGQGICYLDINTNIVYKLFYSYLDDDNISYTKEEILFFSNIENDTFIWPLDVISIKGNVIGYTSHYKRAKNLYETNPFTVNLVKLLELMKKTKEDIKLLSEKNVAIYDMMYNTLLSSQGIYVIDTLDYGNNPVSFEKNSRAFNAEFKYFLVDGLFDDFVMSNKILKEMYSDIKVCPIEFLKEFKKSLSEYLDSEVNNLSTARKLVRRSNREPKYIRII